MEACLMDLINIFSTASNIARMTDNLASKIRCYIQATINNWQELENSRKARQTSQQCRRYEDVSWELVGPYCLWHIHSLKPRQQGLEIAD